MIDRTAIRRLIADGAEEITIRTKELHVHFRRLEDNVLQIDRETGAIMSRFPLEEKIGE